MFTLFKNINTPAILVTNTISRGEKDEASGVIKTGGK